MAVNNGKIVAPVSINDIKSATGSSSNDLGTLCKYSGINKWSRVKPVSIDKLCNITDQNRKDVVFGILPIDNAGIHNLNFIVKINLGWNYQTTGFSVYGLDGWGYTKPSGGSSSPYRMEDFKGYNHNAVPMLNTEGTPATLEVSAKSEHSYFIPKWKKGDSNDDSITENCEIALKDINLQKVFGNDNVPDYPAYYIGDGTNYRLGVAVIIPIGSYRGLNRYKWLLFGASDCMKQTSLGDTGQYVDFMYEGSDGSKPIDFLKSAARRFEVDTFTAVPFIGCSLLYSTDASNGIGWRFNGSNYDKAITFPAAQNFNVKITNFVVSIVCSISSLKIKLSDGSYIIGTYVPAIGGYGFTVPRSSISLISNCKVAVNFVKGYGVYYDFKGGFNDTDTSFACRRTDNDSAETITQVNDSNVDYESSIGTYYFLSDNADNLIDSLENAPSTSTYVEGKFTFYFTNSQKGTVKQFDVDCRFGLS